jgi:hypothetical protein
MTARTTSNNLDLTFEQGDLLMDHRLLAAVTINGLGKLKLGATRPLVDQELKSICVRHVPTPLHGALEHHGCSDDNSSG